MGSSGDLQAKSPQICADKDQDTDKLLKKLRKISKKHENDLVSKNQNIVKDERVEQLKIQVQSNSSDSESEENIPFTNTAECASLHEGRQLFNIILPVNVDVLRKTLYEQPSKFIEDFHLIRKNIDVNYTDWELNESGEKKRIFKVKMPINATGFGVKFSHVQETQTEGKCSVAGQHHCIDIVSINENIPYADSFEIYVHHCLVGTVDEHTMVSVYAQVHFKKSVWGVIRALIEKNCWTGLEGFHDMLRERLQKEFCTPPTRNRLSRKNTINNGKKEHIKLSTPAKIVSSRNAIQNNNEPLIPKSATYNNYEQYIHHKQPKSSKNTNFIHNNLIVDNSLQHNVAVKKQKILFWFVIVLLIGVVTMNTILFLKLNELENYTDNHLDNVPIIDFSILNNSEPKTHDDWIKLLLQQENLHKTEVRKWQEILEVSINLLKSTENTLMDLLQYIQEQQISISTKIEN